MDSSTWKIRINLSCKLNKTMQEKYLILLRVQYVLISFFLNPDLLKKKKKSLGRARTGLYYRTLFWTTGQTFQGMWERSAPWPGTWSSFCGERSTPNPTSPWVSASPASFQLQGRTRPAPPHPRELVSQGKTQSVQSPPSLWSKKAGGTQRAVIGMKNYAHRRAESS